MVVPCRLGAYLHRLASLLLATLALVGPSSPRSVAQGHNPGSTATPDQVAAEVKKGWAEAKDQLRKVAHIHFTCETRQVNLLHGEGTGAEGQVIKHFYKRSGGHLVYASESFGEPVSVPGRKLPNSSDVFGANSKYSFTLAKAPGQTGWILKGAQMVPTGPRKEPDKEAPRKPVPEKLKVMAQRLRSLTGSHLADHFYLYSEELPDLIEAQKVSIKSVTEPEAGGRYVRVELQRAGVEPVPGAEPDFALFDREALYCLREARWTDPWTDGGRAVFTYTFNYEMRDGFPWLKDYTERAEVLTPSGKLVDFENRRTIAVVSRKPVREKEFTLTAFGLPEPVGVKWSRPTPIYVWVLVAAGGCLFLAFGFRYLARRSARKSPAPSA